MNKFIVYSSKKVSYIISKLFSNIKYLESLSSYNEPKGQKVFAKVWLFDIEFTLKSEKKIELFKLKLVFFEICDSENIKFVLESELNKDDLKDIFFSLWKFMLLLSLILLLIKSSFKYCENKFNKHCFILLKRDVLSSVKIVLISMYQIFIQSLKIENLGKWGYVFNISLSK